MKTTTRPSKSAGPSDKASTASLQPGSHDRSADQGSERGNGFAQDELGAQESQGTSGPFESDWLNDALSACFGDTLGGLAASMGEDEENEAISANASTRGAEMSFGSQVKEDASDSESLEIIAEETAHALAGGGSGKTPVDLDGDPGERSAKASGKAFRAWADKGFEGPAPALEPARGGRAEVHRNHYGHAALTGRPVLSRGSNGALVRSVQVLLNRRGYGLAVDGDFGPATDRAVRAFQGANRLAADGAVGPITARALNNGGHAGAGGGQAAAPPSQGTQGGESTTVTGNPMLRFGNRGPLVASLQRLLNAKGARLTADGVFGSSTQMAVRGFQSANRIGVDGIVGPGTAAKLNDSSSKGVNYGSGGQQGGGGGGGGGGFGGKDEDELRNAVLRAAESHLGKRYYWGADGPAYFDCSGFVLYVLRQDTRLINWGDDTAAGISGRLPKTTNPKKGDPVFYRGSGGISHVTFATGQGSNTIGASGGGSSTFGNDPNAKVKYTNWNNDSRAKSFGSISGLIQAKLGKK